MQTSRYRQSLRAQAFAAELNLLTKRVLQSAIPSFSIGLTIYQAPVLFHCSDYRGRYFPARLKAFHKAHTATLRSLQVLRRLTADLTLRISHQITFPFFGFVQSAKRA